MVAYYCVFVGYIATFERDTNGPETPAARADDGPVDSDAAVHPLLNDSTLSLGGNGADRDGGAVEDGSAEIAPKSALERVQAPLHWLARLTMPEVATRESSYYPRACAVLLPVSAPLFVVLVKRLALSDASPLNGDALLYGAVCSGFASVTTAALYPADGRHKGLLTGFFTTMAFGMSVLWMNILSAEMVRAWKVRGSRPQALARLLLRALPFAISCSCKHAEVGTVFITCNPAAVLSCVFGFHGAAAC